MHDTPSAGGTYGCLDSPPLLRASLLLVPPPQDRNSARRAFCERSPNVQHGRKGGRRLSRKQRKAVCDEWERVRGRRLRTDAVTQLEADVIVVGENGRVVDTAALRHSSFYHPSNAFDSPTSATIASTTAAAAIATTASHQHRGRRESTPSPTLRDHNPCMARPVVRGGLATSSPPRRHFASRLGRSPDYRHKKARSTDDIAQMLSILCHSPSIENIQPPSEVECHVQQQHQQQSRHGRETAGGTVHDVSAASDEQFASSIDQQHHAAQSTGTRPCGDGGDEASVSTPWSQSIDVDDLSISTFSRSFAANRSYTASALGGGGDNSNNNGETLDSIVLTPPLFRKGFRGARHRRRGKGNNEKGSKGRRQSRRQQRGGHRTDKQHNRLWRRRRAAASSAASNAESVASAMESSSSMVDDDDDGRAREGSDEACDLMCNCVVS